MNQPTDNGLSRYTTGFGISLAATSVLSALLVVAKEMSPGLMAAMKRLTGQHWVTHSAAAVVFFIVLGFVLSAGRGITVRPARLIAALAGGVILGGLIIAGFYLFGG